MNLKKNIKHWNLEITIMKKIKTSYRTTLKYLPCTNGGLENSDFLKCVLEYRK